MLHIPAVGEEGTRGSLGQVLLLGGGAALRNCFRGWCSIASWGPFIHAQVERVTHRVVWGLSVCSLPRKPVFPALLHVNQPDLPDTRFADGASWLLLPGSKKRTRESLTHCVSSEFSAPSRYGSLELWVCSIHIVRHASWHHLGMGRAGGRTTCIPAEEATIIHGKAGGLSLVPGGWRLQELQKCAWTYSYSSLAAGARKSILYLEKALLFLDPASISLQAPSGNAKKPHLGWGCGSDLARGACSLVGIPQKGYPFLSLQRGESFGSFPSCMRPSSILPCGEDLRRKSGGTCNVGWGWAWIGAAIWFL